MKQRLAALCYNEGGATSIEYALVGSMVSIFIVAGVLTLRASLISQYSELANHVVNVTPS